MARHEIVETFSNVAGTVVRRGTNDLSVRFDARLKFKKPFGDGSLFEFTARIDDDSILNTFAPTRGQRVSVDVEIINGSYVRIVGIRLLPHPAHG